MMNRREESLPQSHVRFSLRGAPEESPHCSTQKLLVLVKMGHAASVPVRRHQSVQHFYLELLGNFQFKDLLH